VNIEVRIDRLVLDGIELPAAERPGLARAFESELARLLGARGLGNGLRGGGAVPSITAAAIELPSPNRSTVLGRRIARTVHGGIIR
jgi:hypothetical protein